MVGALTDGVVFDVVGFVFAIMICLKNGVVPILLWLFGSGVGNAIIRPKHYILRHYKFLRSARQWVFIILLELIVFYTLFSWVLF
jgi:hypothetical protein